MLKKQSKTSSKPKFLQYFFDIAKYFIFKCVLKKTISEILPDSAFE